MLSGHGLIWKAGEMYNLEKVRREWDEQAKIAVDDIEPLTTDERKALLKDLRLCAGTFGGDEIQDRMLEITYAKHLRERPWWHWGEFEYWRGLCASGMKPTGLKIGLDPYAIRPDDDVYTYATLPKLKKILAQAGIEPPKKNVTKGVAEMIRNDTRLFLHFKRCICLEEKQKEFRLFVVTIDRRALNVRTLIDTGAEGREVILACYEPKLEDEYRLAATKRAASRNVSLMPPYWPAAPHWWVDPEGYSPWLEDFS